jgi:hypothetical protein
VHADLGAAQAELDRLRSACEAETVALPPLDAVFREAGDGLTMLHGANIVAQREVLALLVERIEPIRVSHGKDDAAIKWTPLGEAIQATLATFTSDAA